MAPSPPSAAAGPRWSRRASPRSSCRLRGARRRCTSSSSSSASSGSCRRSASSSSRSCRRASFDRRGWWKLFCAPEPRDLARTTTQIFQNHQITHALLTTLEIAIGGTVLPIFVAALAGYAFAWLDFPGRDWLFVVVIALLVVPLQMALIPIFKLYNTLGPLRQRLRPDPLPHGVRPAVRDLPAAELLHRDPEGHPRVGPHRRRLRVADLPPPDPAARPAGDRLARDLPVPLDVERPARRAVVRRRHEADHGGDLHAAALVQREHRHHRARRRSSRWRSRSPSSSPSSGTSSRGCSRAR